MRNILCFRIFDKRFSFREENLLQLEERNSSEKPRPEFVEIWDSLYNKQQVLGPVSNCNSDEPFWRFHELEMKLLLPKMREMRNRNWWNDA